MRRYEPHLSEKVVYHGRDGYIGVGFQSADSQINRPNAQDAIDAIEPCCRCGRSDGLVCDDEPWAKSNFVYDLNAFKLPASICN